MAIDKSYEHYARLMAADRMPATPENHREWVKYCEALEGLKARLESQGVKLEEGTA